MFTVFDFDEIPSTNDYLKQEYQGYPDFSIIKAQKQTQGRGRFDRVWESTNDLTFSILFRTFLPQHFLAPLAVVLALEHFSIIPLIKWPNDIYVKDKKVCGILIENVYDGFLKQAEIVGIGINLEEKRTTLEAGYLTLDKELLLKQIQVGYELLMGMSKEQILKLYRSHNMLRGRKISLDGVLWEVQDIQENGYLQVGNETGIRLLKSEEISFHQIHKGEVV